MTHFDLDLHQLAAAVSGRVIGPEDSDYDEARTIFYGGYDRRPGAIVRVAHADDVARVVTLAAETGTELAVRSGGHSLSGHSLSEGGLVVDLSAMRGLDIDPVAHTAWAETGLTTGAYTQATGSHGLATGFGDTGSVGIGGITLSGGIGYLVRKHGLTIDSVLAAEVVTADGRIVRADPDTNPDLFWAIRGGGGNFGVVTRLQFRLHEVSDVVGGMLILPASPEVVAAFVAETDAAPEEFSAISNLMVAPPMPFLPQEVHGQLVLMNLMAFAGDIGAGEKTADRLRALAEPLVDMVGPTTYPELFVEEEMDYHPLAVGKNRFIDSFDEKDAETVIGRLQSSTAMASVTQIRVLGGAAARVPSDATAFAHRHRKIMINVGAMYQDPEEKPVHTAWVNELADLLAQGEDAAYAGFITGQEPERAYPEVTRKRLREIKQQYDPDNLFRLNQNISPE